jgi:hypothetical protein
MKVKSIDTYTAVDGQKRWRIYFEDDDKPLIMGKQPSFKVGDNIPKERLKEASKGDKRYYIWARETTPRKFGKSQEELDQSARTMSLSYAKDVAVAGFIPVGQIIELADKFLDWIKK